MNLLVCTSSNSSANSIRPELEIYISMAKAGHQVTLMTHRNEVFRERFLQAGINLVEQPVVKKISFDSIRQIRQIITEHKIDVVYATNSKAIPNTAFACIGKPVKLVVYRGTAKGLYWYDPANYLSMLHPRIDGIICVSKYVADYVSSKYTLRNKRVKAIYKGHDLNWYNKKAADLTEFGISKNDFTVICVINSRPHKGLDIMLKATNHLSDIENLHVLLVGNGADQEPYKSLLDNSEMQSRIHLAGYRNDAPELIAASQVLIQPSTAGEGLPRVILESLAYRTPVIASANKGSMEIIEDGINGYIVPLADPQALAERIRFLQQSADTLAMLSSHSQDILKNKMSHHVTTEKYIKFFESM